MKRRESFLGLAGFLVSLGIRADESRFAYERILVRLNAILGEVARTMDWRIVDGLAEISETKGYCSEKSWFNTYGQSMDKQGLVPADNNIGMKQPISTGAMHPNIYGHYNVGILLTREFAEDGLLAK